MHWVTCVYIFLDNSTLIFTSRFKPSLATCQLGFETVLSAILDVYGKACVSPAGVNPRPHQVRALSTSVAFLNDCNLKSILEAAYWK